METILVSESRSASPVAKGWMKDEGYWMRRLEVSSVGEAGGWGARLAGWDMLVG